MKRVVIDASALAALTFEEPHAPAVARRLHRALLVAPPLLKFELANVAWKKLRSRPTDARMIFAALDRALHGGPRIQWHEVGHADAILIARATGLSTYDASYLWLAGYLGADLVTLDARMSAASAEMIV